jgi:cytochrome c553
MTDIQSALAKEQTMTLKILSFRRVRPLFCGLLLGSTLACQNTQRASIGTSAAAVAVENEIATLKADVQTLKDKAPSASVAMADVSFHWANLYFAGQAKNWPLANYYYSEARNHVRWLIRINPMPKGPDGMPVDLKAIFDAIDTSTFAALKAAIDKKDSAQFPVVHKAALESCYSCHKSVGRPYLRPQIPKTVPQTIVNLDPGATWPQ